MTSPDSARLLPIRCGLPLDLVPIVLLADDEAVLRELLRDSLEEEEEFRVLVAENGQDALALAQTSVPDVLVTDVVMPRLDGFNLVRAVRRLYPGLPVIIITGDTHYRGRPIEDVAAEHEVVATLTKPFDFEILRQLIRNEVALLEPSSPQPGTSGKRNRAA